MALQPQQVAAQNMAARKQLEQSMINSSNQQVVPEKMSFNASNPYQMITQGLSGISNAFSAPERRAAEQANLDAADALLTEQRNYNRGQDAQKRDDLLAAQKVEQALARDKFEATNTYNQENLDIQRERLNKESRPPATRQAIFNENDEPIGSMNKADGLFYDIAGNQVDSFADLGGTKNGRGVTIDPNTGYDANWSDDQIEVARGAAGDFEQSQNIIDIIDEFGVTDYEAAGGKSTYLPNVVTGSADGQSKFEQLGGKGFLENISSFEGKGALSDAEGRAIRQAYSGIFDEDGLKTGVSEGEVFRATETIRQNMEIAKAKAARMEMIGRPLTSKERTDISSRVSEETPIREWNTYRTQSTNTPTTGSTGNDYSNLW